MGTFRVSIDFAGLEQQQWATTEALVDTGATYTSLPVPLLRRLGIVPHERRLFEPANGQRVERDVGRAWVRIDGRTEIVLVVFGEEQAPPLLGAVTLETFGLAVDPVKRRLRPVPGLLPACAGGG